MPDGHGPELDLIIDPQMKRFADEYIKTGNGKQSALKAGYSDSSAATAASRLLRRQDVRAYMAQLQNDARNAAIADAREIQAILTAILRGETTDPALDIKGQIHDLSTNSRERIKAADVLSKIQGLQSDTIHLETDQKIQFFDNWSEPNSKK